MNERSGAPDEDRHAHTLFRRRRRRGRGRRRPDPDRGNHLNVVFVVQNMELVFFFW